MGAYSPVPFVTKEVEEFALEKIMRPTAKAMVSEGVPFVGVLYGGLILTAEGPKVIEFNARFGDPETEVVLPRLTSDICALFEAAIDGVDCTTEWSDEALLGVVMASNGYPGSYKKGAVIEGVNGVESKVYHMGTTRKEGKLLTAGGRVLMVVGRGATLAEAKAMAEKGCATIECEELFYRKDIGHKVLN